MRKVIPFEKDIPFENNIHEITSISLENTLSLKEKQIIGDFIVSGAYKMTEASINLDKFRFDLPFNISIDQKYDTKNINVDINDFYYEVVDNKILSVNIEVVIDGLEEIKEEINLESVREAETIEDTEENKETLDLEETIKNEQSIIETKEESKEERNEEIVSSLFDNMDDNENYVTYKVHIVTENDTLDSIIQKYEVTINQIENYNNIQDLKIGDKIIIPTND